VPIAVFVREKGDGSAEILQDAAVNQRIAMLRAGRRRRLYMAARANAFSVRTPMKHGRGRRHLRRLVRFRLDARFLLEEPRAFSRALPASSARSMAVKIQ